MANVTITFDPDDPTDVARAVRHLYRFAPADAASRPQPTAPSGIGPVDDRELRNRVTSLVRGYGEGRHGYLRVVAEASPEWATYDDIERLFTSPKGIGGTHSAIERSWRKMGAEAEMIETDMHGNSRMAPEIAQVVLEVLDEYPPSK